MHIYMWHYTLGSTLQPIDEGAYKLHGWLEKVGGFACVIDLLCRLPYLSGRFELNARFVSAWEQCNQCGALFALHKLKLFFDT